MRGAALHAVEPSYEGFGTAPRELLIRDAQALVVARAADPIDELRRVFKLPKGRGQRMFKRVRRVRAINTDCHN